MSGRLQTNEAHLATSCEATISIEAPVPRKRQRQFKDRNVTTEVELGGRFNDDLSDSIA